MRKRKVILIGCGSMAQSYYKVLKALDIDTDVIGRGKTSANAFKLETGETVKSLDIDQYLEKEIDSISSGIVCVSIENLASVCRKLIDAGIKNILLEKPGALYLKELHGIQLRSKELGANIFIAYNRRFYHSVEMAREIIKSDGGILSCNFDFTEWAHQIEKLEILPEVKENWFMANSSHIADLIFHLIGKPMKLESDIGGSLQWHKRGSLFVGHGISVSNIFFSYHANWSCPGRWRAEFITSKHKLIFCPIEKLKIVKIGSVEIEEVESAESIDNIFKPGLYNQTKSFLNENTSHLCSLDEQIVHWTYYNKIANYYDV